jgi:Protein of unknown function (DUF1702)
MTALGKALKPLFEVSKSDFGPPPDVENATTERLQQVVFTVTECCHITLRNSRFGSLVPKLDAYDEELRGFAYEGAGVGLAALDTWLPWRRRTAQFVAGPAARYLYAIYLGAGMGLARMHRDPEPFRVRLDDPLFSWVVLDGYGFHEGFFRYDRYVTGQQLPKHVHGYGRRAFDHGLGRSMWFSTGATVTAVVNAIGAFPGSRRPDLWSGVGLACGYTGGVDHDTLEQLRLAAGDCLDDLKVGVVVAANARHMVGNLAGHNEAACQVLCGMTSQQAADIAGLAVPELPAYGAEPAYEIWRQHIRHQLGRQLPVAT